MTLEADKPDGHSILDDVVRDLANALKTHGFKDIAAAGQMPAGIKLLLKRQNWNTNRAVVVASVPESLQEFGAHVRQLRDEVARQCGFIPVLWPIGIQVIISGAGTVEVDPAPHLALVDNQWALIQSVFLVDPQRGEYREARTWGQYVTGKFQDAISRVLACHYRRFN